MDLILSKLSDNAGEVGRWRADVARDAASLLLVGDMRPAPAGPLVTPAGPLVTHGSMMVTPGLESSGAHDEVGGLQALHCAYACARVAFTANLQWLAVASIWWARTGMHAGRCSNAAVLVVCAHALAV